MTATINAPRASEADKLRHLPVTAAHGGDDAEALFKEARQRERRRRLVALAAILLAVALGVSLYAAVGGQGPNTRRPAHTGSSSPVPAPGTAPWSQAPVTSALLADQPVAVPGTPYAYAISVKSTSPTSPTGRLVRIDLRSGHITGGVALPSSSELFSLAGKLAVLSPRASSAAGAAEGPYRLRLIRGTDLGSGFVVPRPGPAAPATAYPTQRVWLPGPDSVTLVDVSTGAVLQTVRFSVPVASISVDPTGRLLYVALDELVAHPDSGKSSTVIEELDAASGRLLARRGLDFTLGGALITAVRDGVWVSVRGGMMGTAELLRSSGLTLVPPSNRGRADRQEVVPTAGGEAEQGIGVTSIDGNVWLQTAGGISCVAPSSGRFRAGRAWPTKNGVALGWDPFTNWNGLIYAIRSVPPDNATEVLAVRPPSSCGGA